MASAQSRVGVSLTRFRIGVSVDHGDAAARHVAARVTALLGIELLDVRWVGTGSARTLRLVIDRPTGVSADACAAVSQQFDVGWEADHGSRREFFLEVTSPGPSRPLVTEQDFARVVGRWVEVTYTRGTDADTHERATVTAQVAACAGGALVLGGLDEQLEVPLERIERARMVFMVGSPTAKRKPARRRKRS